jgi:hypothetical protein
MIGSRGWMAAVVATEALATIIYFWVLGLCMTIQLAKDAIFRQPSPLEAVENEIRREFGRT